MLKDFKKRIQDVFFLFSSLLQEELLASNIIQYLQSLIAQSAEQEKLSALRLLLDPDRQDPKVSRETFHSTMREWIAQCSHNR